MADATQRGKLKSTWVMPPVSERLSQMLADGQAAARRGVDIVLAYFEPHAAPTLSPKFKGWRSSRIAKSNIVAPYSKSWDTEAVLMRRPSIALVDELAHTNIAGSARTKRWQDVEFLLDAGIEVWTTMNLQHMESVNDEILQITGIQVRETVPDGVIRRAEEVVTIDVTPRSAAQS